MIGASIRGDDLVGQVGGRVVMILTDASADDGRAVGDRICAAVRNHRFGNGFGAGARENAVDRRGGGAGSRAIVRGRARGGARRAHQNSVARARRRGGDAASASRRTEASALHRSIRGPRAGARVAHAVAGRGERGTAARRERLRRRRNGYGDAAQAARVRGAAARRIVRVGRVAQALAAKTVRRVARAASRDARLSAGARTGMGRAATPGAGARRGAGRRASGKPVPSARRARRVRAFARVERTARARARGDAVGRLVVVGRARASDPPARRRPDHDLHDLPHRDERIRERSARQHVDAPSQFAPGARPRDHRRESHARRSEAVARRRVSPASRRSRLARVHLPADRGQSALHRASAAVACRGRIRLAQRNALGVDSRVGAPRPRRQIRADRAPARAILGEHLRSAVDGGDRRPRVRHSPARGSGRGERTGGPPRALGGAQRGAAAFDSQTQARKLRVHARRRRRSLDRRSPGAATQAAAFASGAGAGEAAARFGGRHRAALRRRR